MREIKFVLTREEFNWETKDLYGYRRCKIVYVLYEDQTWENICVYDGDFGDCPQNSKLQLASRLKSKTRERAIEIIKDLIEANKMVGKLMI